MAPKENMKVMKTIDSDGEPCEKKKKKNLLFGFGLPKPKKKRPGR
jgi:hypothetical protein